MTAFRMSPPIDRVTGRSTTVGDQRANGRIKEERGERARTHRAAAVIGRSKRPADS